MTKPEMFALYLPLTVAVIIGAGIAYLFGIPVDQSLKGLVAGVVAWLAVDAFKAVRILRKEHAAEKAFWPIQVEISPHWRNILSDFRILNCSDEAEYESLIKQATEASAPWEYSPLRSGLSFTILKPTLVYQNDSKTFTSRGRDGRSDHWIGFGQQIPGIGSCCPMMVSLITRWFVVSARPGLSVSR
jgi:hypothetical protein